MISLDIHKTIKIQNQNNEIAKKIDEDQTNQSQIEEVGQKAIISSIDYGYWDRRTGVWPFDDISTKGIPGKDYTAYDDIVRSFDEVSWVLSHNIQLKEGETESLKGGRIEVNAELPENCEGVAKWNIEAMDWAENPQISADGRTFTAQYTLSDSTEIIPGTQSLKFVLKILSAPNELEIKPTFISKLVGNTESEKSTLTDTIRVTSAPSYNIQIVKKNELNYRSYFDLETGKELGGPTDTSIYGRMQGYAITLQLYNENDKEGNGIRGIELPQGDIKFDIKLSEYNGNKDVSEKEGYRPILWDYIENEQDFDTGAQERNITWSGVKNSNYGRQIAPYNTGGTRDSCYNGGSWELEQDSNDPTVYHVTIKNYEFDMEKFKFPTNNAEDQRDTPQVYGENVGCFSAGYIQTIMQMPEIVDEVKNIDMKAEVKNLNATSISGAITNEDKKNTDNVSKETITLYPEGNYNKRNYFSDNEFISGNTILSSNWNTGDSYASISQSLYIWGMLNIGDNNSNTIKSINMLQKFDDKAFYIAEDSNSSDGKRAGSREGVLKTLYAAKPDKTGWIDDEEMQNTREKDLLYFTSMYELQEQGYKCVGVLFENRNLEANSGEQYYYGIRTFINENAKIGQVYQTVNDVTVWENEIDFSWENKKFTYDEQNGLIYENIHYPAPTSIEYNGKNKNTPQYIKSEYDENGQIKSGTHNGNKSGNSCLIIGANLGITKQSYDGYSKEEQKLKDKNEYDLNRNENQIKYIIKPTLTNRDNNIRGVDLKITDTLPKGIKYKAGSTIYSQNKQGVVMPTNPEDFQEPEITINEDGSTTLVWYMYNCTVNEQLSNIYYIATIDKETKNNTEYTSKVVISEILNENEKSKIGNTRIEKRTSENKIIIVNTGNYSFYKTAVTQGIEENGVIHYKIVAQNNTNTNLSDFQLLDQLPLESREATEDSLELQLDLRRIDINKKNIETEENLNLDNIKVFSTQKYLWKEIIKEEEVPTTPIPTTPTEPSTPTEVEKIPITVTDDDFGETEIWNEIQPNQDLETNNKTRNIGLKGVLEANTKIEIDLYLKTNGNKVGDAYSNKAQMQTTKGITMETQYAQAAVINRIIQGRVWEDYDRDGLIDYFEESMENVDVILYDATNKQISTTKTDKEGKYKFEKLTKGNYRVQVVPTQGFYITSKDSGKISGLNSKFSQETQMTDFIQLEETNDTPFIIMENINAGLYRERYKLHLKNYRAETDITIQNAISTITGEGIGKQGPEFKTDMNGEFDVLLVPNQIYTLQQTSVPAYDYMLNEIPIIFKVIKEKNILQLQIISGKIKNNTIIQAEDNGISDVYIEIENEPKYNIRITKYEQGTNNTISYVRFRIKGKDMGEEGKVYQTNINGIAIIPSLELDQTYTIKEEYAKGYYTAEEFTMKMIRENGKLKIEYNGPEVRSNPTIEEREARPVIEMSLDNISIPKYNLELTKLGEKTGRLLQGAQFKIEGAGRDEFQEIEYETNENGTLIIEKLYENEEYTLTEVVPPIGYKIQETPLKFRATQEDGVWSFKIIQGQLLEEPLIEGSTIKVKYEDELLFKLQKIDEETERPIAGAKFTIKDLEGNEAKDLDGNPVGEIEEINGEQMRVVTTDDEGFYTAEIATGLYRIEEVKTIFGYDLPENPVKYFGIDASQEGKFGPKEIWASAYATANSDVIERVALTSDGGKIFAGQLGGKVGLGEGSDTIGDDSTRQYVLVKYNKDGKVVWQTQFKYGYINFIKETKNGGLLVVGSYGICVYTKSEDSYELEWETPIATRADGVETDIETNAETVIGFVARYIDETEDGFVLAGQIYKDLLLENSTPETTLEKKGDVDIFIIKYKKSGNSYVVDWTTTIYGKTSSKIFITSLMVTSDNGILLGGATNGDITLPNGEILTNSKVVDNTLLLKYDKDDAGPGYVFSWGKRINGDTNRITGIVQTTDGEYVVGGYFSGTVQLSNRLEITGASALNNLVVKYDKFGNIRFGFGIGGANSELINHVAAMKDGGFITVGSMASEVTLENGQVIKPKGGRDALIVRYDKDAHVKWANIYGGTRKL